jgi:SanA protein
MKLALMEKGVPTEAIHLDYAGFSTLDSVVRAKEVFQQTRLIVISQEFHVRRAVYIGKAHDLDIVGSIATDVSGRYGLKTRVREYLARVKTLLDIHIWNRSPKFLGEPINLG